jgi:hypothetical protein
MLAMCTVLAEAIADVDKKQQVAMMKIILDQKMRSMTPDKKKRIKKQSEIKSPQKLRESREDDGGSMVVNLNQKSKTDPESILNYAEKLIDHLDEYRMKLENRHAGMGDVRMLVNSMKVMRANLALKIYHVDENAELTELLESALQIVTAEINAFETGCYLN